MNKTPFIASPTYEDYVAIDKEARIKAQELLENI
jgi:hypothetical protein